MLRLAAAFGLVLLQIGATPAVRPETRADRIRREVERAHLDPVLGRRPFVAETGEAPWLLFLEIPAEAGARTRAIATGRSLAPAMGLLFRTFEREIRPGLARAAGRPVPSLREKVLKVWMHPDARALWSAWRAEGKSHPEDEFATTSTKFWRTTGWFRSVAPRVERDDAAAADRRSILTQLALILLHETGRGLRAAPGGSVAPREERPPAGFWLRVGVARLTETLAGDEESARACWRRCRDRRARVRERRDAWTVPSALRVETGTDLREEIERRERSRRGDFTIATRWTDRVQTIVGWLWFADGGRRRGEVFAGLAASLRGEDADAVRAAMPSLGGGVDREAEIEGWLRERVEGD